MALPPLTLYLDTSVIGGYFDEEFAEETRRLWELALSGGYRFVASAVTEREIAGAPPHVSALFIDTFTDRGSLLPLTSEAEDLALRYIAEQVVSQRYLDDAQHIAASVIHRVEVVVSWNFKHLANLARESGFNRVNRACGYPEVKIITPKHLIYGHETENL